MFPKLINSCDASLRVVKIQIVYCYFFLYGLPTLLIMYNIFNKIALTIISNRKFVWKK